MLAKASSARSAMRVFRRVAGAGGGAGSPALGSVRMLRTSSAVQLTYSHAIVRDHSPRFAMDAVRFEASEVPVSQAKAERQHGVCSSFESAAPCAVVRLLCLTGLCVCTRACSCSCARSCMGMAWVTAEYVAALRKVVPHVVELPALAGHPDCVFVEDTAVVVGSTAMITAIGHPDRAGEEDTVAAALADLRGADSSRAMTVVRASELSAGARVDGGDVLYTGHEIFVGASTRTNEAGVEALRAAFPGTPVHPIKVSGALHLKSLVTLCAPGTLVASSCDPGRSAAAAILEAATATYSFVHVQPAALANVVLANGTLFHRAEDEHPGGSAAFAELPGVDRLVPLHASEVEKADGALTCCSILVNLP